MKTGKRQFAIFAAFTVIGIVAIILSFVLKLKEGYNIGIISGAAGGFTLTGIIGMISSGRLLKDASRAQEVEMLKNEERTVFLRLKTQSSVFSVNLIVMAVAAFVFTFVGYVQITVVLAALILLQAVLYVIFAIHYQKKY